MQPNYTPFSSRLDRDALMMVSRDTASEAAFTLLDSISRMEPHVAVAGLAVAFAAFAERVGMAPDEIHAVGSKVLRSQIPYGAHSMGSHRLDALQDFAKLRIRSDKRYI